MHTLWHNQIIQCWARCVIILILEGFKPEVKRNSSQNKFLVKPNRFLKNFHPISKHKCDVIFSFNTSQYLIIYLIVWCHENIETLANSFNFPGFRSEKQAFKQVLWENLAETQFLSLLLPQAWNLTQRQKLRGEECRVYI